MKIELVNERWKKAFVYHSTNEWISIYGDVKDEIIEVKHNTRRKRKATINIFVTQKITEKNDKNIVRKNCFENASLSQMDIVDDFS